LKWLFGLLASLLCASSALAQTAPMTSFGFVSSQYCDSVTTEFPKAPWCYQPKSGLLYLWNGSNGYSVFNGLGSFSPTLAGVVTGASSANVFNSTNTSGNEMDNALIINNASGHNGNVDLQIQPDTANSDIAYIQLDSGTAGVLSWFEEGPGGTGAELDFGVQDNSSSYTQIECDSPAYNFGYPGYCYINSGDGFGSPFFKFITIYSAAGTAIPAAASANNHARACVSDSTACTSGTTYTSGGSTACELWSNGSAWKESGSGC